VTSDFEGRVAAIGATTGYSIKVGDLPVSKKLNFFHEFASENRATGDVVFATLSIRSPSQGDNPVDQ
jgi:hypothetical protein